jgi:hypothetical protein
MALLVLNNDITNAHHTPDPDLPRLVNDCLVSKAGGHEAQAIWACERRSGSEPSHIFHIVTQIPSEGHDLMKAARDRSRGVGRAAGNGASA